MGLLRTEETRVVVSRIRRPDPTLLAINLSNPMALASWADLILRVSSVALGLVSVVLVT